MAGWKQIQPAIFISKPCRLLDNVSSHDFSIVGGVLVGAAQGLFRGIPLLNIVGIETRRPGTSADRLIDNILLSSPLATHPVVGYENHAGRTYLAEGVKPFGAVVSSVGHGNNDADKADGALCRKVLGTYLHGPLLSKNPEIADWLLVAACERHARRTCESEPALARLDDAEELAANAFMADKAGAK